MRMKRVQDLMSLSGRVAVVTGAAGHIGSAFCEALAEVGAGIVLLDIEPEKGAAVACKIGSEFGVKTVYMNVDLADESQIRNVPAQVLGEFDRIDVLVNCAAVVGTSELGGWTAPFLEQQTEAWRQALEVNLTATFVLTQACVPNLRESGKGSIINIGSIYGLVGPDLTLYEGTAMGVPAGYAVSKGGLLQLTRYLATVLAPDIRVNALSPGGVWRMQDEAFHARYKDRTPTRRMATEEDLKGGLVFLASDMSSYVTGQNLVIDGGWTVW